MPNIDNFILAYINKPASIIQFYCPHCKYNIMTDSLTSPTGRPLPGTCSSCKQKIDNTGIKHITTPPK